MDQIFKISVVDEDDEGERLDKFITENMPVEHSRSFIQRLIKEGSVLVNAKIRKSNYVVKLNDEISVKIPTPVEYKIEKWDFKLDIVYEDEYLLVLNKPAGLVVHPAFGHMDNKTLVNALLFHCKNLSGINGVLRPGIVHRLDKDTSGLMIVAKEDYTHRMLSMQLQQRTLKRKYVTICCGVFEKETLNVSTFIGRSKQNRKLMAVTQGEGKEAISDFKVIERFKNYTLLEVSLQTGRTHQIRVHLKYLGYPVLGDEVYGKTKARLGNVVLPINRQSLHAYEIEFIHPILKKEMKFSCAIPEDINDVLSLLRK